MMDLPFAKSDEWSIVHHASKGQKEEKIVKDPNFTRIENRHTIGHRGILQS